MITSNIYFPKYRIIWMIVTILSWRIYYHGQKTFQNEFENRSNLGREHRPLNFKGTRYGAFTSKTPPVS